MSKSLLLTLVAVVVVVIVAWFMKKSSNTDMGLNTSPTTTPLPTATELVSESPTPAATTTAQITPGPVVTLAGGLKVQDLVVGTGVEAKNGKTMTVHYVGTLENGTKFDSSVDRGQPFNFTLGAGEVIQGWDKGVLGMKVGGKRKLIIPSALGYGSRGAGNMIPPNATLIFQGELLAVN